MSGPSAVPSGPVLTAPAVGRRSWVFATLTDEPRSRRATDAIMLVGACGALAVLGAITQPPPGVERRFMAFVAGVPDGVGAAARAFVGVLAALAALLAVAAVVVRRWAVVRDLVLAGALAFAASVLIGRLSVGSWQPVWASLRAAGSARYFPPLSVAIPVAVVLTASPHLHESLRRFGRWSISFALLATVVHQSATPTGALAAMLVGAASAAVVHLLVGSANGRPSLAEVGDALAELGVDTRSLGAAERQPAGLFVVDAVDGVGTALVVKVYGRDAHDTQLLTTLWRTVWYREAGSPTTFGRQQQAEHEALLTLLAAQAGIRTDAVVTASATSTRDVVLVLRRCGTPLEQLPTAWDGGLARAGWETMQQLHRAGIAHGQLDQQHLVLDGGQLGLIDFRGAAVAPTPAQLHTDAAQLLVTTARVLGVEAAVAVAHDVLGSQRLAAALPFVQLTALTRSERAAVRSDGFALDELRTRAAVRAGTDPPELQRMQRVRPRSLLQIVLLVAAFFAVAVAIGGLDLDQLAHEVRDATWWLIGFALVLGQVPRLSAAVSVLGASPAPLPLGPVYALQLATSYITLAVPTTAARVAVNVRFLQRHGLRAGTAFAVGAIDAVTELVVQLVLVAGILLLTPTTLHLDLDGGVPSGLTWLVVIVAAVAVAAIATVLVIAKWRGAISSWLRDVAREAAGAVRGLRSPRRLGLLLGANVCTEVLLAITLLTFARALGFQLGLAEVVLITVSVRVISGLVPIPGGIGVAEGGLAFGLVRAGLPEEAAFAAVLLYRLATFYLPPIWGFFALRWLERNKHV